MISKKLVGLLVVTVLLSWFSLSPDEKDSPRKKDRLRIAAPVALTSLPQNKPVVTGDPWRRIVLLPAIEPIEPMSAPVFESEPLAPVEEPPPPPPPSAPSLPVAYLGRLLDRNVTTLYVRYQESAVSLKVGDMLGEDYTLEKITANYALFRYLPMDISQELRWDGQE